ncbi:MAG: methyl-accepting chemotaxis protein [Terasakiella sp.]|uniref:methyl-accepting chemotaxis protein n=1 Tax=unclassified Terasakiella TaxID=2614952 RepID=UPI003AFF9053
MSVTSLAVSQPLSVETQEVRIEQDFTREVRHAVNNIFLSNVSTTTLPTVIAAILFTVFYWDVANHTLLFSWGVVTVIIGLARLFVVKRGLKAVKGLGIQKKAGFITQALTGAASLGWIATLPLFFTQADIATQTLHGMLLLILTSAGTVSLSVDRKAFMLFVPPILLTLGGFFASSLTLSGIIFGFGFLLVLGVQMRLAKASRSQMEEALTLRFQNDALLQNMERTTQEIEADKHAQVERTEVLQGLTKEFENTISAILSRADQVAQAMRFQADHANGAVQSSVDGTREVTQGAGGMRNRMQDVAEVARGLSSSLSDVNARVSESAAIARSSNENVERANETVNSLMNASNKVGEIVGLIDSIADQTNMLALNATIEAARAGEAGKGFAVVAGEVKTLANQTSEATREISSQVQTIRTATAEAVQAMNEIAQTIGDLSNISHDVVGAVEKQGHTIRDVATRIETVADDSTHLSGRLGEVDASAEETSDAVDAMIKAADSLAKETQEIQCEVDQFLSRVRSL